MENILVFQYLKYYSILFSAKSNPNTTTKSNGALWVKT